MGLFFKDKDEDGKENDVVKKKDDKKVEATPIKKTPSVIKSTDSNFSDQFNTQTTNTTPNLSGVRKQEVADYFQKVFEENNIPGPDYLEVRKALEKMKNIPQDEATKIKTVFIGFEAMGLTPQKLIETAGVYKKLFAGKLTQFDGELQNAFDDQVGGKQKQADELLALNEKIDEEMRKLNEKKLANKAAVENLNAEIQKNTAELNTTKNDWHATYEDIVKEIDGHIDLFNKYLINI